MIIFEGRYNDNSASIVVKFICTFEEVLHIDSVFIMEILRDTEVVKNLFADLRRKLGIDHESDVGIGKQILDHFPDISTAYLSLVALTTKIKNISHLAHQATR